MLTVYRRPSQKAAFLQQMLDLFDELRLLRGDAPRCWMSRPGRWRAPPGTSCRT